MSRVLLLAAFGAFAAGGAALFAGRRASTRVVGVGMAGATAVLVLIVAAWQEPSMPVLAVVSSITITGLVAFAWRLERRGQGAGGTDLDLDRDPLRWH